MIKVNKKSKRRELKVVGYWKPLKSSPLAEFMGGAGQPESEFPDPRDLVDYRWREDNPDAYDAVLEHLTKGQPYNAYKGSSTCRICGLNPNGSEEFTDGAYYWPSGYAHYIRDHAVVPPKDFVEHVLSKRLRSGLNQMGTTSGRFSSSKPNISNIPRPDREIYEIALRIRPPTYREEAEAQAFVVLHGKLPPGYMVVPTGLFVVENYGELLKTVGDMHRPPLEPIGPILEANSVKGPPEDFDIKVTKE